MPALNPQLGFFLVLALVTVGGAIGTVGSRNLFHSALFLVLTFFGVAGLYLLLEADFLAVAQVLIYVGAIATLIVFAIMLSRGLAKGGGNPSNDQTVFAAWGAIVLFVFLLSVLFQASWPIVQQAVPQDAIVQLGNMLLNQYVVPFEVASVLLFVALIGAIIIAREKTA